MVGLVAQPKICKFEPCYCSLKFFFLHEKSTVLSEPVWPAECPLRPAESLKGSNRVPSCDFCESEVIFDD